jgi:hypothetical protein
VADPKKGTTRRSSDLKIQILTVMEQRAKVAGKRLQAEIARRGKEAIRKARKKNGS